MIRIIIVWAFLDWKENLVLLGAWATHFIQFILR